MNRRKKTNGHSPSRQLLQVLIAGNKSFTGTAGEAQQQ
jgi:hypothetical protein